jgi:NAD(P)-dependent dehydrogenase (short-subunit alcohol dehydrogenase family)
MNLPFFDLTGKVAIISGGATGIGRGIADGLAEAGANIVIAARRVEKCEQACEEISRRTGVKTFPHRCDVNQIHEIHSLVEDVVKEFGRIDILVNNSGVGGSERPILKMNEEDWDSVMNTNLKAAFTLSQAVVPKMIERGEGGKVINVASIGGVIAFPNMVAYCVSKAGCVHLTKVMALEWIRYNIQVNAILPGYCDTPLNKVFFSSDAGKKVINDHIPMRRLGQIEEIKGVAILLASQASSFMTGSAVVIDGGQTIW